MECKRRLSAVASLHAPRVGKVVSSESFLLSKHRAGNISPFTLVAMIR